MNIVFLFESTYPYYTGGVETWIYNVCENLIKNHSVSIVTVENFRNDTFAGYFDNINKKINICPIKDLNHIPIVKLLIHKHICILNSLYIVNQMYKECKKIIKNNEEYCIIALGTVFMPIVGALLQKKSNNIKTVSSCRTTEPEMLAQSYPGTGKFCEFLQKKYLHKMDEVWANGNDTHEYLLRKDINSVIIKNGVNYLKLAKEKPFDYNSMGIKGVVIVTVGSVSDVKGYKEIIQAVSILKKRYDIAVNFVGVGKVRERHKRRYMNYAESLGIKEQVHLIGEHRNVVAYDKGADIVVCCSGGSGYGMSILEAMVSQTPIVAWNNEVHNQLLTDGLTAKLVKAWDSNELADGIRYVLMNPEETKKWGSLASESAKHFDWKVVTNEIEDRLIKL